ncbi:MAG: DUF3459 domain-containing protein, partial [Solirubrobacteraceae bacterium]
LYRRALAIRREHPALGDGELNWLPAPAGALAFAREPGFACIVNMSAADPVPLPRDAVRLVASGALSDGHGVPRDTAVWLTTRAREETTE